MKMKNRVGRALLFTVSINSISAASMSQTWALEKLGVLGDSITADSNEKRYDQTWDWYVTKRLNARLFGLARGGQTAADASFHGSPIFGKGAVNTFLPAAKDMFLQRVIIFLGTNDYAAGVPMDQFKHAYGKLLSIVGPEKSVCIIPTPRILEDKLNPEGLSLNAYRDAIRELCSKGVIVETETAMKIEYEYYEDGLHFNSKGHRALGRLVIRTL